MSCHCSPTQAHPIDPSIVYDEAGTAIQYAHDGYIVVAVNDCKTYTGDPAELQRALNHEVADCFGREVHYV